MDGKDRTMETEAELEAFRQRWRDEVSARKDKKPTHSSRRPAGPVRNGSERSGALVPSAAGPSTARRKDEFHEDVEPKAYHDLPDKEEQLRLGEEGQNHDRNLFREPSSALEHYEKAVEKETQGQQGDAIRYYRRAFKLDDGVHEAYKRKHFPPSVFQKTKQTNPNPSNASATVLRTDPHSLRSDEALPATMQQLVDEFSGLRIEPPPPPTDASPQEKCPIARVPEEILTHILDDLAVMDVASFARLSQVCKRLAYLVLTERSVWKSVATESSLGFQHMLYDYVVDVEGNPLDINAQIDQYLEAYPGEHGEEPPPLPPTPEERAIAFSALTEQLLHTHYQSSWRQLFRTRPRIRFNGCYISTVNYTRPGAANTNTLTWGAPVFIVTYFRYLRFFRDGSCISLLTTTEPGDVVHYLTREHLHDHHNNTLPSSVMRDALKGRWRLSGPHSSSADPVTGEDEHEGDLFVETEGVVPKYTYKMHLAMAHAGKGTRNNKLAWKGFWSYNKLTDDWSEFGLRNDRAFYWSRVKSYGLGE